MAFFKSNKSTPLSDQELITLYRTSGNLKFLSALYDRYIELVYGLCLKYLKDANLAQDKAMEIFEVLAVKMKKHEVEYFKSWLYTLSKNHCIEYLRKNNRTLRQEKHAQFMYSEQVFHPDNVGKEDQLIQMEKCIKRLPIEQRQCVRLFYLQNKSYNEIEDETSLDWNRIRSHIQNGRRNLKICMQKNGFK